MADSKHPRKIQIKKYSELGDTWSFLPSKGGIIDGTQVDLETSRKILDILNTHGYDISILGTSNFLEERTGLFGNEDKLIEYRAEITKKYDYDDFKNDYLIDNNFDSEDDMNEDDMNKMEEEYFNLPYDSMDGNVGYSFFVGKNMRKDLLKEAAVYYGFLYMKLLMNVDKNIVKNGSVEDNCLANEIDGFKYFLNNSGIHISNKNVERVTDINYRIYTDTKFFLEAKYEIKEYNEIISKILEL